MEFLLVNHPLDCPICDQAGECDLQVCLQPLTFLSREIDELMRQSGVCEHVCAIDVHTGSVNGSWQ